MELNICHLYPDINDRYSVPFPVSSIIHKMP